MELIENKFNEQIYKPSDINEHIETLYKYGKECKHITEMGVRWVSSTWAFLLSSPNKLISYDIVKDKNINEVYEISKIYNLDFHFYNEDVLKIKIEPTELLFIDTLHTYNQLYQELNLHSESVSKYIILHDTETFGDIDEKIYSHASEKVKNLDLHKKGLKNAYEDFLKTDKGSLWKIHEIFKNNNGLTILKKI